MYFELSAEADKDLEDIFDFSYNEFGLEQAVNYVSDFDTCFDKLCNNPVMGRACPEIR